MRRVVGIACLLGAACAKSSTPPAAGPTPSAAVVRETDVIRSVPMSGSGAIVEEAITMGSGAQAVKAFVPDAPAEETGGECMLTRTSGNGALTATAFYPTRTGSKTQVSVTFDSTGRAVRYSEIRGVPHAPPGLRREQVDSARRAVEATLRSTSISFDYAVDRGFAMNRGGGKRASGVTSSVRDMESLESLGRPSARLERMRKLCGV